MLTIFFIICVFTSVSVQTIFQTLNGIHATTLVYVPYVLNSTVSTWTTCWCCQTCSFSFVFFGGSLSGSSLLLSATLNRSCLPHRTALVCDIKCCSCLQHIKLLWSATSNHSCPLHQIALVLTSKSVLSATSTSLLSATSKVAHLRNITTGKSKFALVRDIKSLLSAISKVALVYSIKLLLSAISNDSCPLLQISLLSAVSNRSCPWNRSCRRHLSEICENLRILFLDHSW